MTQGSLGQHESLRGCGLVPVGLAQCLADQAAFNLRQEILQIERTVRERKNFTLKRVGLIAYRIRKAFDLDGRLCLQGHGAFDRVFQLPDIARPVVSWSC